MDWWCEMNCTEKEQMTCNSEKQGCNGCYYNKERVKENGGSSNK